MHHSYPQYIDFIDEDTVLTLWNKGEVAAVPTETVYGLAADAENDRAVARIYQLKSRPSFNPLIIHVADIAMAKHYARWNEMAEHLAAKFWPGPLTLVLPTGSPTHLSTLALAGGDTVALRVPAHPILRRLIAKFGRGVAAPSANQSGRVSPTTAAHVRAEFGVAVPVLNGGACAVGLESTVVDLTGDIPIILRPGAVTREMIETSLPHLAAGADAAIIPPLAGGINKEEHAGGINKEAQESANQRILKSPGQLAAHYAPSIPVRRNATSVGADEALLAFGAHPLPGAGRMLNLSPSGDLVEAAANLFAFLRALDDGRYRTIAVMPIPETGLGEAINDRLRRAEAGSAGATT
jgi:L-threonylcarbamoyladenylate synthase